MSFNFFGEQPVKTIYRFSRLALALAFWRDA